MVPTRRPARRSAGRTTALVVAGVVLAACSASGFDRDGAVSRAEGTGMTPQAAECYVDRVADELGADLLEEPAPPADDPRAATLAAIRVDCVGVDNLGTPPATGGTVDAAEVATFGADPVLDELWVGCERGDGAQCDRLFEEAPLGSDYESFGATCGNRGAEPTCAEVYPG